MDNPNDNGEENKEESSVQSVRPTSKSTKTKGSSKVPPSAYRREAARQNKKVIT